MELCWLNITRLQTFLNHLFGRINGNWSHSFAARPFSTQVHFNFYSFWPSSMLSHACMSCIRFAKWRRCAFDQACFMHTSSQATRHVSFLLHLNIQKTIKHFYSSQSNTILISKSLPHYLDQFSLQLVCAKGQSNITSADIYKWTLT